MKKIFTTLFASLSIFSCSSVNTIDLKNEISKNKETNFSIKAVSNNLIPNGDFSQFDKVTYAPSFIAALNWKIVNYPRIVKSIGVYNNELFMVSVYSPSRYTISQYPITKAANNSFTTTSSGVHQLSFTTRAKTGYRSMPGQSLDILIDNKVVFSGDLKKCGKVNTIQSLPINIPTVGNHTFTVKLSKGGYTSAYGAPDIFYIRDISLVK